MLSLTHEVDRHTHPPRAASIAVMSKSMYLRWLAALLPLFSSIVYTCKNASLQHGGQDW
jgi:hypothetical protein